MARRVWEKEQIDFSGFNPNAVEESIIRNAVDEIDAEVIPWYCRYLVVIPGELLQIATQNEVVAAVHRVVVVDKKNSTRISAPVLLRARCNMVFNKSRYLSSSKYD